MVSTKMNEASSPSHPPEVTNDEDEDEVAGQNDGEGEVAGLPIESSPARASSPVPTNPSDASPLHTPNKEDRADDAAACEDAEDATRGEKRSGLGPVSSPARNPSDASPFLILDHRRHTTKSHHSRRLTARPRHPFTRYCSTPRLGLHGGPLPLRCYRPATTKPSLATTKPSLHAFITQIITIIAIV